MRTSMILGTVLLSLTTRWLMASETAPPPMPLDVAWTVDTSNTLAYPDWLQLGREFRPELRSILSSEAGNLQYWIRVPKDARGTIAVAVGEAYWAEPGHRIMDIRIDGRVRASRIDPIAVAGGKHRLAVIACEAEDLDGDGLLHVEIVAAKDAPDHVTLAAGLWWLAGQTLTAQQVVELPRVDHKLKPDLFIGHGLDVSPWKERFSRQIQTEDPQLNAFDFHPPMDDMKLTPHPQRPDSGPWYGNVEGVEQTCFLLMSEEAIAELAAEFGQQDLAEKYRGIVARRIKAVQEKMWDPQTQFFYSLDRDSHAKIPVRTIQGFLTLACGAATREQAEALVKQLQDPKQWWATYPIPTVALDDPKFGADAMWRGDMWPATTYLVACGLHRYGYHDVARQLAERMRQLIAEHGINERYNALTGRAIGDPGVAMTCSAWPLLVQSLYGVQDDFRTIVVPSGAQGRRLHLGKLEVVYPKDEYPKDDVVELRTAFPRQFRVVFADTAKPLSTLLKCDGQPVEDGATKLENGAVVFTAQAGRTYAVHQAKESR